MIAHLATGELTPGGAEAWTLCGKHLQYHVYESMVKAEADVRHYADSRVCKRCKKLAARHS